jgi:hypothetical protein
MSRQPARKECEECGGELNAEWVDDGTDELTGKSLGHYEFETCENCASENEDEEEDDYNEEEEEEDGEE